MIERGYEFSFSGLKTAVRYFLDDQGDKREQFLERHLADISASVSHAITEVLVVKLRRALRNYDINTAVLAGGVAANSMLREKIKQMAKEASVTVYIPDLAYCTDNAAMIAWAGLEHVNAGQPPHKLDFEPKARWPL